MNTRRDMYARTLELEEQAKANITARRKPPALDPLFAGALGFMVLGGLGGVLTSGNVMGFIGAAIVGFGIPFVIVQHDRKKWDDDVYREHQRLLEMDKGRS